MGAEEEDVEGAKNFFQTLGRFTGGLAWAVALGDLLIAFCFQGVTGEEDDLSLRGKEMRRTNYPMMDSDADKGPGYDDLQISNGEPGNGAANPFGNEMGCGGNPLGGKPFGCS